MISPQPELMMLVAAVVVGLVQLLWAAGAARGQQNMKWAGGARDEAMPLCGVAARLDRAYRNFMETFPLFAVVVIAAYLMAKLGPLTVYGSVLYVASRAVYVPLYAAGVPLVRSVVWTAAMAGIVMIIVAIFQ
jgi:uncharacterized MAPEG superfamily protein